MMNLLKRLVVGGVAVVALLTSVSVPAMAQFSDMWGGISQAQDQVQGMEQGALCLQNPEVQNAVQYDPNTTVDSTQLPNGYWVCQYSTP